MEELFTRTHFEDVLEHLHEDQTGLLITLKKVQRIVNKWSWIADSRGCYEWNDDRYYSEIGQCFDAIEETIRTGLVNRSNAHQICCNTYRHIRQENKEKLPVQEEFKFEEDSYENMVETAIKFATIKGCN